MKLSFSTRGWEGAPWEEWIRMAGEMRFSGVEIYNAHMQKALFDKSGPFHQYCISSTVRLLAEKKLEIPCLDSSIDLSGEVEDAVRAMEQLTRLAADLRVPYIGVYASGENEDAVRESLRRILPRAAENRVTVLIKTAGIYADTERLRDLMNYFACDELAATWDLHHTVRDHGETPAVTIKNLGAYVRHVQLRDSDDEGVYNLIGEGTLPIPAMMDALASINYDGFISLVWKTQWMEDLQDR